jgi:hypothetical protein
MAGQIESVSTVGLRVGSRVHRIKTRIGNIFGYYNILVAVAAPFATAVAGVFWINENLPRQVAFRIPEVVGGNYFISACIIAAFLLGLTMVSAYVIQNMHLIRQRDQSFNYDKHGTLFNGDVPNVAFRVSTVKMLFSEIARAIDAKERGGAFKAAGRAVGANFAKDLAHIMDQEVLMRTKWEALSFNTKLDQWALYDSATGWGLLFARWLGRNKVVVRVSHFRQLFEGEGGEWFVFFLSGYCEAVVSQIVEEHNEGSLSDYESAIVLDSKRMGDDIVEFNVELQ